MEKIKGEWVDQQSCWHPIDNTIQSWFLLTMTTSFPNLSPLVFVPKPKTITITIVVAD